MNMMIIAGLAADLWLDLTPSLACHRCCMLTARHAALRVAARTLLSRCGPRANVSAAAKPITPFFLSVPTAAALQAALPTLL
jgi:hypothetical protein